MLGFRHWIERAAKFDDVPVAVVPVVQQRKIIPDFVDRHRVPQARFQAIYRIAGGRKRYRRARNGGSSGKLRALAGRCHSGHQIVRRQCVVPRRIVGRRVGIRRPPSDRAGMIGLRAFGDDLVEFAGAAWRALTDRGRCLTADFAGRRLALAELAHVRDCRGRGLKWLPTRRSAAPWPFQASCPSATARAPARARTPCEAEKTFRDPGRLFLVLPR